MLEPFLDHFRTNWPLLLDFAILDLLIAFLFVAILGPRLTARLTKTQTEEAWGLILPRLRDELQTALAPLVAGLTPPSPEVIAEAQDGQRAALRAEIDAAIEAAMGRITKFSVASQSAAGVDARTEFKEQEQAFMAAVLQHGGPLVAMAVEAIRGTLVYKTAVRLGVGHVPRFLEEHKDQFTEWAAKFTGSGPSSRNDGLPPGMVRIGG